MFFHLFEMLSDRIKTPFSIKLPNSQEIQFGSHYGNSLFQIEVHTERGESALKSGDELKIAEAYIYGDIDLNGNVDMLKLLEIKNFFVKTHPFIIWWTRIISFFSNQIIINKKSIAQHYEFDDDFYLMFLDETRTYSHGVFMHEGEPSEEASKRKLEFAMKSCHLKPGDKVLDLGAGWGSAVEYLGTQGIHVDAITISEKSAAFVSNLIKNKNLSHCRVFKKDFLEYLPSSDKKYDAIFSLGTLEHLPNYKKVLQKCSILLHKNGYAYFDASAKSPKKHGSYFIERHIFPGNHECLDIYGFLDEVKKSAFELISLHNDTYNYYLTLKCWAKNLDFHKEKIISKWGKTLYRKFQIYFGVCCYSMFYNELQAYRIVLQHD